MKGNPKRPPWSQPLCQSCYVIRFEERCTITSPWQKPEFCFDCGAVTSDGIYRDVRPAADLVQGPGGHGPGESQHEREVRKWIAQHGEYRYGAAPGSAEESPSPAAASRDSEEKP